MNHESLHFEAVIFIFYSMDTPISEQTEAPVAETVVETPTESAPEAPSTSEDVWSTPFEFTAEEETEAPTEGQEPEAEITPVAPETDETAEVVEEEDEAEPIQLEASADKPAPLSRRKLREVEDKVLIPFRDPDADVLDAYAGLHEINPARAEALAQALIQESIEQYPDHWAQVLTGIDGVTVESLKQKYSNVEPTQVTDGLQSEAEKQLTEFYGDSWRDPANDHEILDEHLPFVKAFREQTGKESQALSEKELEIQKLQEELNSLRPEVESIKTAQQAEFELRVTQAKDAAVSEYQAQIEKRSLPHLFEQAGLKVSESDTDAVKGVKEYIQGQFKSQEGFMSPFEQFAVTQFSKRDDLGKIIARVDKYLDEATKAEVKAKTTKDANEVRRLEGIAQARRQDAKAEQDRLTVLHKAASQEFVKTIPVMGILEELADANRRLALRGEIVGTTAAAVNSTWRDSIDPNDPWGGNTLTERAAHLSR